MKKIRFISVLLAAALLALSLVSCDWGVNPVPDDNSSSQGDFSPHKFGVEDAAVNGVKLGMTEEQVTAILGDPNEKQNITNDNFIYGEYTDYRYDNMNLTFYDVNEKGDFSLGIVYTDSPKVKFVNGLHVGSTKDDILKTFTQDDDPQPLYMPGVEESFGDFIYGSMIKEDFVYEKPEGEIQIAYINRYGEEDSGEYMMEYYYYPPLTWNDGYTGFTGDCWSMVFYMDSETDTVTTIRLNHDLAEN